MNKVDKLLKALESSEESFDTFVSDAGHYRGYGIQIMGNEDETLYVAQIHDLQHPNAEMGDGLEDITEPFEDEHQATKAAHKMVDKIITDKKKGK